MKILLVLEYFYPHIGGVEELFKQLADQLINRGHTVRVITCKYSNTLQSKETINGVEIIRVPLVNRFLFSFFGFPLVVKYAKGFDIIHTTSYNAALPAFIAAKLTRKKCIITFHEVWGKLWFELPYLGFMERKLYWLYEQLILFLPFDFWIAVSNYTHRRLNKGLKSRRIYNGIEYKEAPPLKVKEYSFVFFGRLGVSKGLNLLIESAKRLKDKANFNLLIIIPRTTGLLSTKLIAEIRSAKLSNHVTILHDLTRKELELKLAVCNCVVIPSYSEGFCFSAVEAVSYGLPVISSGRGALKEVISGKHLEMKEFTVEALENVMIRALKNEWVETPLIRFELSETVDQYIKLYQELILK